ncbi:hypothetical protein WDJ51_03740, partial [Rathayibacter sp. YIM 133350]
EFPRHVFIDGDASAERIRAFAEAPNEEQRIALTALRSLVARSASAHMAPMMSVVYTVFLGYGAIVFTAIPAQRATISDWPYSWLGLEPLSFSFGPWAQLAALVVVSALSLALARMLFHLENRSRRAGLILAAYEGELRRRENASGWRARRWRKAHPIEWS